MAKKPKIFNGPQCVHRRSTSNVANAYFNQPHDRVWDSDRAFAECLLPLFSSEQETPSKKRKSRSQIRRNPSPRISNSLRRKLGLSPPAARDGD